MMIQPSGGNREDHAMIMLEMNNVCAVRVTDGFKVENGTYIRNHLSTTC